MALIITKKCRSCGIEKELKDFDAKVYGRLGTTGNCTLCRDKYRDKINQKIDKDAKYAKTYKKGHSRQYILKKYGLSVEEYDSILESQNNVCAVCGEPNNTNRSFCVDHDHKTNKVRGLLCFSCNIGLGKFKDSVKILASAARYLIKNK